MLFIFIDVGIEGHRGQVPSTFHKLLGKVPLCNFKKMLIFVYEGAPEYM